MIERAENYIHAVRTGEILSCKWIKLAIERHFADIEKSKTVSTYPFFFDREEADRVLSLYSLFRFTKGKHAGKPFDLMAWFAAIVYIAFGWRRKDGGRRFRKVYIKVGRGNAKTENLVVIGNIAFLFEPASDPEVYWVATKKDQSRIGWDRQRASLKMLVSDFPELAGKLNIPEGHTSNRVRNREALSWVSYLGRDSSGEDGASPYCVLVDEYHAWDNDDMLNVMESGMVKVADPMTWIITTAGFNQQGPNAEFLRACKNTLLGVTENDELLAFVYELDEEDDWKDESNWIKPNPGMGISVTLEGLRTEYNKIKAQGYHKEQDFKVKNLNIEVNAKDGWIDDQVWVGLESGIDFDALRLRECWGGLDLAATSDFNAFSLFFPAVYDGEKSIVLSWYWIPEAAVEQHRVKRPFVEAWAAAGYITLTPGNITDYDWIRQDINGLLSTYNCRGIAFDRALSSYLAPRLVEDGVRMEAFQQSWMYLTPPAKHIERMVNGGTLAHDGNPVSRWMMGNVSMQSDRNGNLLPSKGASAEKIDFVASLLNAVGLWMIDRGQPQTGGSYLFEEDTKLVVI